MVVNICGRGLGMHYVNVLTTIQRPTCVCMCSLAEKFQVRDRHFSFLVSSLSDQPVRVHSWHCVNCNELQHTRAQKTFNMCNYSKDRQRRTGFKAHTGIVQVQTDQVERLRLVKVMIPVKIFINSVIYYDNTGFMM